MHKDIKIAFIHYFILIWIHHFVFRPAARRKPGPVVDTGEAQTKFGDVKAISSDMYFGKQDNSEVPNSTLFTCSSYFIHISFKDYFMIMILCLVNKY